MASLFSKVQVSPITVLLCCAHHCVIYHCRSQNGVVMFLALLSMSPYMYVHAAIDIAVS